VTSLQNESGLSKYLMVHEYQSFLILLFEWEKIVKCVGKYVIR
jgi:hypothetical protein